MLSIFTEESPHSKNPLAQYRICCHIERDSQTAPHPSSRSTRRGSNICIGASLLQVTFSPFCSNNLTHSLRDSGCTPTWISFDIAANLVTNTVRNIDRQETQLVDSVPSSGGKKASGLDENPIFLLQTLHAQHSFAINHTRASAGQS